MGIVITYPGYNNSVYTIHRIVGMSYTRQRYGTSTARALQDASPAPAQGAAIRAAFPAVLEGHRVWERNPGAEGGIPPFLVLTARSSLVSYLWRQMATG